MPVPAQAVEFAPVSAPVAVVAVVAAAVAVVAAAAAAVVALAAPAAPVGQPFFALHFAATASYQPLTGPRFGQGPGRLQCIWDQIEEWYSGFPKTFELLVHTVVFVWDSVEAVSGLVRVGSRTPAAAAQSAQVDWEPRWPPSSRGRSD